MFNDQWPSLNSTQKHQSTVGTTTQHSANASLASESKPRPIDDDDDDVQRLLVSEGSFYGF
jgi:hypothetical protein